MRSTIVTDKMGIINLPLGIVLLGILSPLCHGFSCITCNNLPLEDDSKECIERVELCMPGVRACSSVVFKDEKGVVHRRKFCTASGTPMYQQLVEFPGSAMCQNIESKTNNEPIIFSGQDDNTPRIDVIPPQSFHLPPLDNPLPKNHPIMSNSSESSSNSKSPRSRTRILKKEQTNLAIKTNIENSPTSVLVPPDNRLFANVNTVPNSHPPAGLNTQDRQNLIKGAQGPVHAPGGTVAAGRRSRQAVSQPGDGAPGGVLPPALNPHRPASTSKHISTLICVCTKEKCNAGDYPETVDNILMQNIDKPVPKKESAIQFV